MNANAATSAEWWIHSEKKKRLCLLSSMVSMKNCTSARSERATMKCVSFVSLIVKVKFGRSKTADSSQTRIEASKKLCKLNKNVNTTSLFLPCEISPKNSNMHQHHCQAVLARSLCAVEKISNERPRASSVHTRDTIENSTIISAQWYFERVTVRLCISDIYFFLVVQKKVSYYFFSGIRRKKLKLTKR